MSLHQTAVAPAADHPAATACPTAPRRRGSAAAPPAAPALANAAAATATPSVSDLARRLGWLGDGAALREDDNVTALHARSAGARTRLVGLAWIDGYQGVLALPDAGITEPAQLERRRLALPRAAAEDGDEQADVRRSAASRGFHAATGLACLFCDEYAFVEVTVGDEHEPYAAETAALLRGEVDAIYVAGAAGRAVADQIGAVEVVDLGAHLDPAVRVNATTPTVVTVEEDRLRDDRAGVVAALATLLRAGTWAERRPEAVASAYGLRGIDQQFHVDLSARKLAALSAQNDFLRTHGFLAGDAVDLAAWAEPGPLAAARDLLSL